MSTLLEQASLVMIPSGYKEDVVYSQIPTSGAGDLSFTRASNGTRVNSAGLVEVCPWNLLDYSEGFNASYWTKRSGTTITADTTTAPNGTLTADTATLTSGDGYIYAGLTLLPSTTYTISVYAKGSGTIQFNAYWGTGSLTGSAITLTSDWQRLSFTFTTGSTTSLGDFGFFISATCYIWGAQLNIGTTAKPYFPTTDRLNVPRLTYQNGGGGCPSLLLEKQSTNLVTYSEQFDNVAYANDGTNSITANATTSPDGTQNADLLTSTVNGLSYIYQNLIITNGAAYTVSVFAKAGSTNFLQLDAINNIRGVIFNLSNGTIASTINGTGAIESVGNGWYKCSVTRTATSVNGIFLAMPPTSGSSVNAAIGNSIYIWGAQLEASSYATSYIGPTTSASATRVADACFKTGISSLIGQTEGVMFVDVDLTHSNSGSNEYLGQIRQDSGNRILLYRSSSTFGIGVVVLRSGGTIFSSVSSVSSNSRHKIAIAYKSGDLAFYIDGNQIATNTTTFSAYSSLSEFDLGNNNTSGTPVEFGDYEYKEALLFPTRLTNAELASLTTI